MGVALDAAGDLVGVAAIYVAIACLALIAFIAAELAQFIDVSIAGYHPFAGAAAWIEGSVVDGCQSAIKSLGKLADSLQSGLIDAFGMLIAIPALLFLGVRAALQYLWNHALRPLIHSITDVIHDLAAEALALAKTAIGDAEAAYSRAVGYVDAKVESALSVARSYADSAAHSAQVAAEGYADTAVAKLRAAEDSALANVTNLVRIAESDAQAAAALATTDLAKAEAFASTYADAIGKGALRGLDDLTATVEKDFNELVGKLGLAGAAGLIASIPLLATLVNAIATEAGLGNAECRQKVKGICGTDPLAWAGLLAGAAFMGGALSLRDLLPPARLIFDAGKDLIEAAA